MTFAENLQQLPAITHLAALQLFNAAGAQEGLALFAEHTADARLHPGSHPNIDRLLDIIATGQALSVKQVLLA